MFQTLRARLTALATGITLAVSLLVCVALYFGIRHSLYQEVDGFLAGEVMEFRSILTSTAGDLDEAARQIRDELGSRQRGDLTFRLLTSDGRVIFSSAAQHPLVDPWPVPSIPPTDLFRRTEHDTISGAPLRTCSLWVADGAGAPRILQATYLLDQVESSLRRFLEICAASLAGAALLATVGGRILAIRGLKPLNRMAIAAQQIGVTNLNQRLETTGTGDELDLLASTFNDMLARLESQVAQLRQFTADAAHELRTPLAALRGHTEVALSRPRTNQEFRTLMEESLEEFERLTRIAEDLLLLARAEAGQPVLQRAPLRLDAAIADVVDLFHAMAEERGVELTFSERCEIWVDGDSGRLRQMFGNLLDNALKFTTAGGKVQVSLVRKSNLAQLTVRDSGVGIAPEHLPRLFDRFYRVDQARSRASGGAGLGLAICRAILEAHRGEIRVESRLGRGTDIIVRLPMLIDQPMRSVAAAPHEM